MSEIINGPEALRQSTEAYVTERLGWITDAVEVLTGDRSTPVEEALSRPMEKVTDAREDSPAVVGLPEIDEQKLRDGVSRFGMGKVEDVMADLPEGYVDIKEGGLVWKMLAEQMAGKNTVVSEEESDTQNEEDDAGSYVYPGFPGRPTTEAERIFQINKLGIEEDKTTSNEYESARLIAELHPDHIPFSEPLVLPFGYDIHNKHSLIEEPTGQIVQIGTQNNKPVLWVRVDHQPQEDDPSKFVQGTKPDTADIVGIISDVLTACGDDTTAIAITTSNTYPSRVIDSISTGLTKGRQVGASMYGRKTLADAKKEEIQEPTALNQIPPELRVIHDKLLQLREVVNK
jgi:hypothetical protein